MKPEPCPLRTCRTPALKRRGRVDGLLWACECGQVWRLVERLEGGYAGDFVWRWNRVVVTDGLVVAP